ncbi:hypothetical protein [Pseudomonas simiae]
MEHLSVTEQQADSVRSAPDDIEIITKHAISIFDRLQKLLAKPFVKEEWGISFVSQVDGPSAELSTPFGRIRMDLVPFVDDQGVQARYVIEKEAKSPQGEVVWRKVWSLRLDKEGRVFQGSEISASFNARHRGVGEDNDIASLALSILYVSGTDLS